LPATSEALPGKDQIMPQQSLTHRVRIWLQSKLDIARMQQMDDHLLRDMGVERTEIGRRVRGR
jgi:uncharacterized protein YjiS (DUF1127 family)